MGGYDGALQVVGEGWWDNSWWYTSTEGGVLIRPVWDSGVWVWSAMKGKTNCWGRDKRERKGDATR